MPVKCEKMLKYLSMLHACLLFSGHALEMMGFALLHQQLGLF